jgi:HSP20 family protein
MNLVRFNAIAPKKNLIDEMLDNFFNQDWEMPKSWARFNQPLVNLIEEKDAYRIEMAIPGVNREDVEISLDKEQLIIRANREENHEADQKHFTRKEFYFGKFEKSFHIPETVNRDAIEASFRDGVLHIELKKKDEAIDRGPQQIEIK